MSLIRGSRVLIVVVGGLFLASTARAELFGFQNITANNVADAAIGEAQLSVDLTAFGANQVQFRFLNSGPLASSITDVYFDAPDPSALDGISSIDDSFAGVSFSLGAAPGNLPGANNASPPFVTSPGLSADSDPAAQPNGVNPGEELGIIFDLDAGKSFADVLGEMTSGALRVGIHVQGFASGGSESFVTTTTPVPSAAMLGVIGLGTVGWVRRRKLTD